MRTPLKVKISEKKILDERLKEFRKNPKEGRSLDDLVAKISRKYGIKNSY